jgi:hypothetical protein
MILNRGCFEYLCYDLDTDIYDNSKAKDDLAHYYTAIQVKGVLVDIVKGTTIWEPTYTSGLERRPLEAGVPTNHLRGLRFAGTSNQLLTYACTS